MADLSLIPRLSLNPAIPTPPVSLAQLCHSHAHMPPGLSWADPSAASVPSGGWMLEPLL
jgi:hypothetical protein